MTTSVNAAANPQAVKFITTTEASDATDAHQIMEAAAVVMAEVFSKVPADQRDSWQRATLRAAEKLLNGVIWGRAADGAYVFQSESEEHIWHTTYTKQGCSCRAALNERLCWHRPAARMIAVIRADQRSKAVMSRRLKADDAHDVAYAAV